MSTRNTEPFQCLSVIACPDRDAGLWPKVSKFPSFHLPLGTGRTYLNPSPTSMLSIFPQTTSRLPDPELNPY